MELDWKRTGPGRDKYTHNEYTFIRKGKEGTYKYELWQNGQLLDNTLDKYGVLKVIRDGYLKNRPSTFR